MLTKKGLLCFSISLLALGLAVLPVPSKATPASRIHLPETIISVDVFDDELDSDGDCSLREAIQAANTDSSVDACPVGSGRDIIILPAGTYTLTRAGTREDGNVTGDIDVITGSVTINGAVTGSTVIDGNQLDRVLHVHSDASVELHGVTIANGHAPNGPPAGKGDDGGGIYNAGSLILDHSRISSNFAGMGTGQDLGTCGDGGEGGGIYNTGVLTVTESTVSGNSAGPGGCRQGGYGSVGGDGGGIYNAGILIVFNSTIASNAAGAAGAAFCCGGPGGDGGGIYNAGTVTLTYSSILSNTAGAGGTGPAGSGGPGGHGGGIYNGHILAVTGSTFRGNSAGSGGGGDYASGAYGGDGGGIYNGGTLQVARCTLSDNAAGDGGVSGFGYPGPAGTGGGIYSSGTLTVADSTISGNKAGNGGGSANHSYPGAPGGFCGGLDSAGPLLLTNSTISDNRPGYGGQYGPGSLPGSDGDIGGLCAGGAASIRNTIIANSALPSVHDCLGSVNSQGHNLVEVSGVCVFTATGDIASVSPQLGFLANNGGDTFTHALLPGSPAIDQGSCHDTATDQRGRPRPVDISSIPNADDGCDIGAYELQQFQVYLPLLLKNAAITPKQMSD